MTCIELTNLEWAKVLCKRVVGIVFSLLGGHYWIRRVAKTAVIVVVYHRIIRDDHKGVRPYLSVTESNLRRQIQYYKMEYQILSLDEAIEKLQSGSLERSCLVISFDDGYEDNHSLGLKIFQEEGVHPAVFVTTRYVDRQIALWPDRLRSLVYNSSIAAPVNLETPAITVRDSLSSRAHAVRVISGYIKGLGLEQREAFLNELENRLGPVENLPSLMLDWEQVRELANKGVTIGSHSVNHLVMSKVPDDVAAFEIEESKRVLEGKTGRKINTFAYPNGTRRDFTPGTIDLLRRSGYLAAVTTVRGANRAGCDLFRLRRTGIYLTDSITDIQCKFALESLLF